MNRTHVLRSAAALGVLALVTGVLALQSGAVGTEQSPQPVPAVALRSEPAETVLYTIHQGSQASAAGTAARLLELRDDEGLSPEGDHGYFVYLNDPDDDADRLIEVRLPVSKSDIAARESVRAAAADAGLGTTDVKEVAARSVAVIDKPAGVSDPTTYWNRLYSATSTSNDDYPAEKFAAIESIGATCAYDELATELVVGTQQVSNTQGVRR